MLKTQTSVSERRGGGKQEEKVVEESKREVPRENSYAAGNSGASAKKKIGSLLDFFDCPYLKLSSLSWIFLFVSIFPSIRAFSL